MFTFPILSVRKVIDRGIADAAANSGFRVPYRGISPTDEARPGLWLVGDEGVYLCSNGKLAEGQKPLVAYAEECHPVGNPDWWDYKRCWFGAMTVSNISPPSSSFLNQQPFFTHLQMRLTEDSISLHLIRR